MFGMRESGGWTKSGHFPFPQPGEEKDPKLLKSLLYHSDKFVMSWTIIVIVRRVESIQEFMRFGL